MFDGEKQCLRPFFTLRRLQTLFEAAKHCLKPRNNVSDQQTMFQAKKQCFSGFFSEKGSRARKNQPGGSRTPSSATNWPVP
jgi:hypothetical protein